MGVPQSIGSLVITQVDPPPFWGPGEGHCQYLAFYAELGDRSNFPQELSPKELYSAMEAFSYFVSMKC
jgi:hypothetical protein